MGAGLSGLCVAVDLVDAVYPVIIHEAAGPTGGRCRSDHDPQSGMTIDNGNHPGPSGSRAPSRTRSVNLLIARDRTDTGLRTCIEGAIRFGNEASRLAIEAS
ncbi:FAD-dependent oxidoreductase [Methylorubrum sp. B1-46]|uniref:FAD-dependent oxidoreductase n=1 Tax=Methylorubrum sp. B1-46 TaxID=2897334 RepID=UPI00351D2605